MRNQLLVAINNAGLDYSSVIKINERTASHLASKWVHEPFSLPTWDSPIGMDNNLELASSYFFFGNLINFGFEADSEYCGPVGDTRFWLRLRSQPEILEVSNLINFSEEQFLAAFGELPYHQERVKLLREGARVLRRMYNGKVGELYEANNWNAPNIIGTLGKYFPGFRDVQPVIPFFRRAILTLFMTNGRFQESNLFANLDLLPIGADSQTFNGLLQLGILEMEQDLLAALRSGIISQEIILALRCSTICAAELLLHKVNEVRKEKISTCHLDYMLRKSGTNGRTTISLDSGSMFNGH